MRNLLANFLISNEDLVIDELPVQFLLPEGISVQNYVKNQIRPIKKEVDSSVVLPVLPLILRIKLNIVSLEMQSTQVIPFLLTQ